MTVQQVKVYNIHNAKNNVRQYNGVLIIGECKHSVAFVMWLNRRYEAPSTTSTECYWKKSVLSTVIDPDKVLKLSDIMPKKDVTVSADLGDQVLNAFIQKKPLKCQLYLHFSDTDNKIGSIHSLLYRFLRTTKRPTPDKFLVFAKSVLDVDTCKKIEEDTRQQSKNPIWFEMRYARISASTIYEASKCKTQEGSLVNRVMGVSKFKGNFATRRGIALEEKVLKELERKTNQKFDICGFIINRTYPFIGASPDAISATHVVEIKCPTKESTVTDYISNDGTLAPKCFAQVQTQMFLASRKKGFFCVADPNFETNSEIRVTECFINNRLCKELFAESMEFWKANIFPKILK